MRNCPGRTKAGPKEGRTARQRGQRASPRYRLECPAHLHHAERTALILGMEEADHRIL